MNILLCPMSDPGYLYPSLRVAIELRRRGHPVSLLGNDTAAAAARTAAVDLIPAGEVGDPVAFQARRWGFQGLAWNSSWRGWSADVPWWSPRPARSSHCWPRPVSERA
jgi:hypothetical protein